ncbi:hypothetical protein IWX78_002184 [Mycetocola sp. CAN_C7]|uniref:DUF4349 domain-containing protein n=1 Tax=Mycetocola sp. CAN_C7 TaxID=2787724 RepID=UPI0018C8E5F1
MELQPIRRRLTRRTTPVIAVLMTCLLLVGCSAGSSEGDAPADGGAIPGRDLAPQDEKRSGGASSEERSVISSASMSLTSNAPVAAADAAVEIVLDVDGHVDSRTDIPTDENQQEAAQLVLRVPSDDLDETLLELKTVGELVRSSLSQTDVTTEVADLDARITALETSVGRLLTLISQATTTADLIDLESALSQRQAELDGLTAQRESLGDLVDFATVEVYITAPAAVAGAAPGDFWGGVVVGFQSLLAFIGGLLVVMGVLIPWLIPVGLLAVLIWWLVRRRDRRPTVPPASGGPAPGPSFGPEESWPPTAGSDGRIPPRPPLPPRENQVAVGSPSTDASR